MNHRRDPLPTDVDLLPELSAGYDATLDAGLQSIGLTLGAAAKQAIADHVRLLLAWNEAINLTAIRDQIAIAREHVVDSLTVVPLLADRPERAILDLGSGGGFPGLPLAIALRAERVLLVESVGKKARFLATVVDALELRPRVGVAATRAETLARDPHHRGRWPVVTARAVGPLAELLELAAPLSPSGGILVAWKRRRDDGDRGDGGPTVGTPGEWDAAVRAAGTLGWAVPVAHRVDAPGLADHVLVVVVKTAPTPPGFPRDPADRKRRPW